jgi:hypothetical protein
MTSSATYPSNGSTAGSGHAAPGDPLRHRPPDLAPDDGGEVARRETLAVAILDEVEDPGEQGLLVEPEVSHHRGGQPRDADEQQAASGARAPPPGTRRAARGARCPGRQAPGPGGTVLGGTIRRRGYPPRLPIPATKGNSRWWERREKDAGARGREELSREEDAPAFGLHEAARVVHVAGRSHERVARPQPPSVVSRAQRAAVPLEVCERQEVARMSPQKGARVREFSAQPQNAHERRPGGGLERKDRRPAPTLAPLKRPSQRSLPFPAAGRRRSPPPASRPLLPERVGGLGGKIRL